jgi:hypothetical protein
MIPRFLLTLLLISAVAVTVSAGTIEGTVSPGKSSVVYHSGKHIPNAIAAARHGPEGLDV